MKNLYCFLLFFIFLPGNLYGQKDYYSTDSTLSVGIKLVRNTDVKNSMLCQVIKGEEIIDYTPYDIKEYGFNNGRVYVSNEIQLSDKEKKVFLERLQQGETKLYYYRANGLKLFFIEKDSLNLVEIPRRNSEKISYNDLLLDITEDCENLREASKYVAYRKRSLTKYIKRYNNCELKPFPHVRFGFTVGYELLKIKPPKTNIIKELNNFNFKYDGNFSLGLFLDLPILVSDISAHFETNYSRHGFSYSSTEGLIDNDLACNFSSLSIPFMIKYAYPSNDIRPYFGLGFSYMRLITENSLFFSADKSEEIIFIDRVQNESTDYDAIDNNQIGALIGGGIEYKISSGNSLFFEIRYSYLKPISNSSSLSSSVINFNLAINI